MMLFLNHKTLQFLYYHSIPSGEPQERTVISRITEKERLTFQTLKNGKK
jgi:hypothetical protein